MAQEPALPNPADTSAVATPFVGEFPVWCTDRNPSNGTCAAHHGSPAIDIGMDTGTPIRASGAGIVLQVEAECSASWCRGGAGLFVEIGHADGTSSRYLHLSELAVETDDVVLAGDLIGLAGNSGSARSPHLHYDEHYPRGTRTPFGPWLSCIGDEVVEYPSALGYSSWNDVPFGTLIRNDGYDCLPGAVIGPPQPIVMPGAGLFAIASPLAGEALVEVEITTVIAETAVSDVANLPGGGIIRVEHDADTTYRVRLRHETDAGWTDWSNALTVNAYPDIESPTCAGLFATGSVATPGIDVLIGTEGDDLIEGGDGADIICGRGGHDTIIGGPGNDWISGGHGRDEIEGGEGRDRLYGGAGRDSIFGGPARDRIVAGAGDDMIRGGDGADIIVGSTGNDSAQGDRGDDRVRGGRGDDFVRGGGGHDELAGNGGVDVLDGGIGTDDCTSAEFMERCE